MAQLSDMSDDEREEVRRELQADYDSAYNRHEEAQWDMKTIEDEAEAFGIELDL
jgi:hypothetical protein